MAGNTKIAWADHTFNPGRLHKSFAGMRPVLDRLATANQPWYSVGYLTKTEGEKMSKEKPKKTEVIFQNSTLMAKNEEEKLMMRAIIFSFSFGLLRVKNIGVSKNVFFHGCEVAFLVSMVASQEICSPSVWPSVIWMLFMLGGLFLVFRIRNSKDPEAAMQGQISSLIFKTIK